MKKYSVVFMTILFFLGITDIGLANGFKVKINNVEQVYESPPINYKGHILVPLRGIFETLGAEVKWNQATQEIYAVKGEKTIQLKIGSGFATVSGVNLKIDSPAQIVNGRTMVPIRFVSEALGSEVKWLIDTVHIIDDRVTILDKTKSELDDFAKENELMITKFAGNIQLQRDPASYSNSEIAWAWTTPDIFIGFNLDEDLNRQALLKLIKHVHPDIPLDDKFLKEVDDIRHTYAEIESDVNSELIYGNYKLIIKKSDGESGIRVEFIKIK